MHLGRKYLLLHDGLSRAKAQVQLCFRGSDPREDGLLAKKAGTVGQVRAYTDKGSGQQPLHINDQCLLITSLRNDLDAVHVQGVLGSILPNLQSIRMPVPYSRQVGPDMQIARMPKAFPSGISMPIRTSELSRSLKP
jgi:hypothetical protein